jgi:hypothetical protein
MEKLQDYPIAAITNTPKEKINLIQSKCSHHINALGYNPETKITQCG